MKPIVAPARMKELDVLAPEPVDLLVERAAKAVANQATDMLPETGGYVVIVAGPGLNGTDGRIAGELLAAGGHEIQVLSHEVERVPACDLVVDAAFGTGLNREYTAPDIDPDTPVLAVDCPSGINGLTGVEMGHAWRAERTVTFAAFKPGLLLGAGQDKSGRVVVADIGIAVENDACANLVEGADVAAWLPERPFDAHKYHAATLVIAGSEGMTGAAALVCWAAMRSGSGYVSLVSLTTPSPAVPIEVVTVGDFHEVEMDRHSSVVIGPGLGRGAGAGQLLLSVLRETELPTLIDGDGLPLLAGLGPLASPGRCLTPHDGEYRSLMGAGPGEDRIAAAKALAAEYSATVLLKGPTSIVAAPDGECLLITNGDQRLATAGTGDVLAGIAGSLLAQGMEPMRALASAAYLHAEAALLGAAHGLMASDICELLSVARDGISEAS